MKNSLTRRGEITKQRIVEAAAALVHRQGARGTSLDQVMAQSGTSKSQLYHYFANKDALLRAVIEYQSSRIIASQAGHLPRLDTLAGLRDWRDLVVSFCDVLDGVGGCPLGSMVGQLADHSEMARTALVESFGTWQGYLSVGFQAMQARGELSIHASPSEMATAVMAALQGGILLAQVHRSATPMRITLDMAIAHVASQMCTRPAPDPCAAATGGMGDRPGLHRANVP